MAGDDRVGRTSHLDALTGDDLEQLQVLKVATEANAPDYAAVLAVLVAAKERYEVQVRTEHVAAELARQGRDVTNLGAHLAQLERWGNVTWAQDTAKVARLEDFRRRRELWQLTAAGHAAHDAILAVLGAAERSGSLQRALFRDIRENLAALADAVDGNDATATYLRLRDLDGALTDLAANARDFHARIAELRREHEVDPERFLAYKAMLLDYLQSFLDDLVRHRVLIGGQVRAVADLGVDRLAKLAAEGDDSRDIFADDDLAATWASRWQGLAAWFVAGPGGKAGVEVLADATTTAIRDLMALLRRLTESASRPVTRASELLHLARWFQRTTTDAEAHELFDAAFGLGRTQHLSIADADADRVAASTTWWEAEPVDVPVTLRRYGKRASPGVPGKAVDYSATKARLAAEHAAARAARVEAAARLAARPLAGRVLSAAELDVLLDLLDRAVHRRPLGALTAVQAEAEGARLHVRPGAGSVVRTERGVLTVDGVELEVEPVRR
jgi:uncharacterized protein (TIGR02677 family)